MCISNMVDKTQSVQFQLSYDDVAQTKRFPQEMNNNNASHVSGTIHRLQNCDTLSPGEADNYSFKHKDMKKSSSFGGYDIVSSTWSAEFDHSPVLTPQELETLFDSTKKEPSKISKAQIKVYSAKYKHSQPELQKPSGSPYREAFEYTQPAHLVAIIACVYLAFRLFPDARRSHTDASTLTKLLYVSSTAAVFGSQFWMTFVSGLVLFFNVPRHVFAQVQAVTFPIYFLLNSVLTLIVIITYTQQNPSHLWDTHQLIQGAVLVVSFLSNLSIRIYLAPVLTKLITIKMAIEREAGMGQEIASSKPGVLVKCPHYMKLHRAFRKTHLAVAGGNIVAMATMSTHLYYVATKLCVETV